MKKSNMITILFSILFVGLIVSIMDALPDIDLSSGGAQIEPAAMISRPAETNKTAVQPTLLLNPTSTPAPPKSELVRRVELPTQTAAQTNFAFTDTVPAADSPESLASDMGACFSMYTRNKNTAENTCKGEWYPADKAPRSYDLFWCATNGGTVGWLPVRFYDGRASETAKPYGSLNQCS